MIKKILALLLCAVMILSMVACSNDTNEPTQNKEPSSYTTRPTEVTEPSEEQDETYGPESIETLGQFILDGKLININNLTKEDVKTAGYNTHLISAWAIGAGNISIGGQIADKNNKEILVGTNDKDAVSCLGVSDKNTDITFFKDINLKSDLDSIQDKLSDLKTEVVESAFSKYYMFHDDLNTMIVEVEDDNKVSAIYLCVSKTCNLNLTEEEKQQLEYQEILDAFKENNPKEWDGYSQEINCSADISDITLGEVSCSFDAMTVVDLHTAGYKIKKSLMHLVTNGEGSDLITMRVLTLTNEQGAEIDCIYTEDGALQYLSIDTIPPEGDFFYDENDVQANYELFGGIVPGMSSADLVVAIANVGVTASTSDDTIVLRNDDIFIRFVVDDNRLDKVTIINAKLAWPN